MTSRPDPPRLLDPGSTAAPQLKEGLRVARSQLATPQQLEALAKKLEPALVDPSATAARKLGAGWSQLTPAKALIVLGLGGAATWFALRATPAGAPSEREHSARPRATEAARPDTLDVPPAKPAAPSSQREPDAVLPVVGPIRESRESSKLRGVAVSREAKPDARDARNAREDGRPIRPRSSESAAAASRVAPARTEATPADGRDRNSVTVDAPRPEPRARSSELELLAQAQRLLARDPARALAVFEEHAQAYPHGVFTEEREALMIDALRRLRRTREFRRRANEFLESYPSSPHGDRIRSWLR